MRFISKTPYLKHHAETRHQSDSFSTKEVEGVGRMQFSKLTSSLYRFCFFLFLYVKRNTGDIRSETDATVIVRTKLMLGWSQKNLVFIRPRSLSPSLSFFLMLLPFLSSFSPFPSIIPSFFFLISLLLFGLSSLFVSVVSRQSKLIRIKLIWNDRK